MALRVAQALDLFNVSRIPSLYETPAIHTGQVSMAPLDEYVALLKTNCVKHTIGLQCPSGTPSSKPTSWTYYLTELDDMPTVCKHQKRTWYNDRTGSVTFSKHMPSAGKDTHSLTQQGSTSFVVRRVVPWDVESRSSYVSACLAAYSDLLNKYIVAKLGKAVHGAFQAVPIFARLAPEQLAARAQAVFEACIGGTHFKGLSSPLRRSRRTPWPSAGSTTPPNR